MLPGPQLRAGHCWQQPWNKVKVYIFLCLVVEEDDLAVVVQLFSHSYFILPTMLPTWVAAVEAFRIKRSVHSLSAPVLW